MNEYIAREEVELPYRDHKVVVTVLAADENSERAIHRAEAEVEHYRKLIDTYDKVSSMNGSTATIREMLTNKVIDHMENMDEDNDPEIDDDHIWTAKYDHEGEAYTRDKDLMAHLQKLRDIAWETHMADTYEAPAAQRKVDEIADELESLLSDEARERWDCDECGHGGGGLCPQCKHEAEVQER